MSTNLSAKNIERILVEAEELVQRFNADVLNEMKEEHRLQFEIHTQNLKKIKFEVQDRIEKKKDLITGSVAEGIHEAILDIVKAARDFKIHLSCRWPRVLE
jgi:3-deoxy-D-manno-octulosonic-acid transferase